jgi:hypothetical protein
MGFQILITYFFYFAKTFWTRDGVYDAESSLNITHKEQQTEGDFTWKHATEAHKGYIKAVFFAFNLGSNATRSKNNSCLRKIKNRKQEQDKVQLLLLWIR